MRAGCFPWPRNQLAWRTAHPSTAVERPEAACATTTGISMGEQAGRIAIPRELNHTSFHKDTLPGGYDTEGPRIPDQESAGGPGEAPQSCAITAMPPAATVPAKRSPRSGSVPAAWTDAVEREWLMAKWNVLPSARELQPESAFATGAMPDSASSRSTTPCMFNPDDNGMGRAAVRSHLT